MHMRSPRRIARVTTLLSASALALFLSGCEPSPTGPASGPPEPPESANPTAGMRAPRGAFLPLGATDLAATLLPVSGSEALARARSAMAASPATVPGAPAGGFPVVLVRPGAPGKGPVVDNLADALALVADGGKIRVFPGEYVADELYVTKSVTIEGTGGSAVIRNDASIFSFVLTQIPDESVTFRGLSFSLLPGSRSSIYAVENPPEVLVEDCSFELPGSVTGVETGVRGDGGRMTVRNSSFHEGQVGVFAYVDGILDVEGGTFADHTLGAVQYQGGASGSVTDSDIGPCGVYGCVRVFASEVDLTNSRLAESRTDVDGFVHNLVLYANGSRGTVSGNAFDGCGLGQCVLAITRAELAVADNTITVHPEHGTRFAIAVSDGTGGSLPGFGSRAATILATGNVVRAAAGSTVADRNDPSAYALKFGGMLVENAGTLRAYGNSLENADVGIVVNEWNEGGVAGSDGGTLEGADNTIGLVRLGLGVWGSSRADFRSNDITDYVHAISEGGRDEPSDLTCNWWGGAAGPTAVDPWTDAALYTPWATALVAGTGAISCGGGL